MTSSRPNFARRPKLPVRPFLSFLVLGPLAAIFAEEVTKEQAEFFETRVRPVLSDNCYRCHSADAGKTKGGLTLDSRDAMLKGGETAPAVVPGDPEKSLLLKAISYLDPELQMPPKGEKL